MKLAQAKAFIHKYRFVLTIIVAELIVGLLVALIAIAILISIGQQVWTAEHPKPRRQIKLVTFPTPPSDHSSSQPAEVYVSMTEFQTATIRANPEQQTDSDGPALPPPADDRPLLDWPVSGTISQSYGCSPYYTGIVGTGCPADQPWFHDGLDIKAPPGMPVRAAMTGTVSFAGPDGDGPRCGQYRGYGLGVIVEDGAGRQTLYAHLSEINVSTGQPVTPETIIGRVGDTGCVSGPHLHLGLRQNGQLVDPANWVSGD